MCELHITRRSIQGNREIGRKVYRIDRIDSTNEYAKRLAESGAAEGSAVIADEQTCGRGQKGRTWHSPPGVNLYMSVILRPAIQPSRASCMTLVAGVAVAEAISAYCAGDVSIKWPNDIMLRGRKVCGILTEMKVTARGEMEYVVVGIGVNVNSNPEDFELPYRKNAISIKEVLASTVSREELADVIMTSMEKWYRIFMGKGFKAVKKAWISQCSSMGKMVTVMHGNNTLSGVASEINDQGALVLLTSEGEKIIISGEIISGV